MNFVQAIEDFLQIKCAFIIIDGAIMGVNEIKDMNVYDILYLMSDASVDKVTVASSSDNWTVVNYDDVAELDTNEEYSSGTMHKIYHTGKTSSIPTYMAREEELKMLQLLFNGESVCINSKIGGVSGRLLEHKDELIESNILVADMSDSDTDTAIEVGFACGINFMLALVAECEHIQEIKDIEGKIPFKYIYTVGTNVIANSLASCHTESFDEVINVLACEYLGKDVIPERSIEVQLKERNYPGVDVVKED